MDVSTVNAIIIEKQISHVITEVLLYSNYLNINKNDLFTYIIILVTDLYIYQNFIYSYFIR